MEGLGEPSIAPGPTPLYFIGRFRAEIPIWHGSLSAIQEGATRDVQPVPTHPTAPYLALELHLRVRNI